MLVDAAIVAGSALVMAWAVVVLSTHTPIPALAGRHWPQPQHRATPLVTRGFFVGLVGAAAALAGVTLNGMLPVVDHMSASVWRAEEPGLIVFRQAGHKARQCRYLGTEASVIDASGTQYKAALNWVGDRTPGSTRPIGWRQWEPAQLRFDADVQPVSILLMVRHDCGSWLPTVVSTYGPWPVPAR